MHQSFFVAHRGQKGYTMYNIEKEIQEILDPLIFNASHELKGHCLFDLH